MINEDFARIYRETIGGAGREGIARLDAFEEAAAVIMSGIQSGRLTLDLESAVRSALHDIDKRDGKSADRILKSAALGDVPLDGLDIDVVVTLGGGLRKQWADVNAKDLAAMDDLRFQNVAAAQASYAEWRRSFSAVLPVLIEYRTFGAAYEAGGFPPAETAARASA